MADFLYLYATMRTGPDPSSSDPFIPKYSVAVTLPEGTFAAKTLILADDPVNALDAITALSEAHSVPFSVLTNVLDVLPEETRSRAVRDMAVSNKLFGPAPADPPINRKAPSVSLAQLMEGTRRARKELDK